VFVAGARGEGATGDTIADTCGSIIGNNRFLLVKDLEQVPAWYLYNLTAHGWNGTEDLVLSNF
jgi:hypothetical protein